MHPFASKTGRLTLLLWATCCLPAALAGANLHTAQTTPEKQTSAKTSAKPSAKPLANETWDKSQIAKGFVYEDANGNGKKDRREKGLAGVAVSDGKSVVRTAADGSYSLPVEDHCVIFVIKPQGYIPPMDENFQARSYYIHKPKGSPELKKGGSAPTGPLPKSLDFALLPYEDPEDFQFFAFGDPQPYTAKEVDYFAKAIVAEAKNVEGPAFGISLGDITGERPDLYAPYLEAMRAMNRPWYNVMGNHDRNYDATSDKYNNEYFEAAFGPSTYAFQYGKTHFIILDDIKMANPPDGRVYVGGLWENQFLFLENYLATVPKGELVVLSYHIPLCYKPGQFLDGDRRRLFQILDGHKVFGLSAHTHIQMDFRYGADLGWNGEEPYHEYNVGTTNGDWYSGKIMPNGLPLSTMRDGTPQGYAIVTIKGNQYSYEYKVAGQPAEQQMTLYSPKIVPYKQGGKYPLYANFYLGRPSDTVQYRIDKGEWKKMSRVEEADPTFVSQQMEWDRATEVMAGRRPNSVPTPCTHLWKAVLDNSLEPGEHIVEVRATDGFGRKHRARHSYTILKMQE